MNRNFALGVLRQELLLSATQQDINNAFPAERARAVPINIGARLVALSVRHFRQGQEDLRFSASEFQTIVRSVAQGLRSRSVTPRSGILTAPPGGSGFHIDEIITPSHDINIGFWHSLDGPSRVTFGLAQSTEDIEQLVFSGSPAARMQAGLLLPTTEPVIYPAGSMLIFPPTHNMNHDGSIMTASVPHLFEAIDDESRRFEITALQFRDPLQGMNDQSVNGLLNSHGLLATAHL